MLTITLQCDFETLYDNSWGQAIVILNEINEIKEEGKEESLMSYLEDIFPEGVDATELNDFLSYDWEGMYSDIGMPLD